MARGRRPNFTDPWDAARVSTFMQESSYGRWKIEGFEITEDDFAIERLRTMHEHGDNEERRNLALDRQVPVGTYVALKREATDYEREALFDKAKTGWKEVDEATRKRYEGEAIYVPIMSDTPAEVREHRHAIDNATGRVLIHGLGLGVLVSALLAKPDVTHIDVVEIDPDVIALTGPYYDDERVTIHRGDCRTFEHPADARWDYVWHDIWSHISARNLNDEEAEHGISYPMMFGMFNDRSHMQGAWAYEEAVHMQEVQQQERESQEEWNAEFWSAPRERQVEMLMEQAIREQVIGPDGRSALPADVPIPKQIKDFFEGQGMRELFESSIAKLEAEGRFTREHWEGWRDRPDPIGNPNAALQEAS